MEHRLLRVQTVRERVLEPAEHLFRRWHVAADPPVELDRPAAFQSDSDVVAELARAHLYDSEGARAAAQLPDGDSGERIERNRPQETDGESCGAGLLDDRLEHAADDA